MKNTALNQEKTNQLREVILDSLADALRPGVFATLTFSLEIQDGTIQRIDRSVTEICVGKKP